MKILHGPLSHPPSLGVLLLALNVAGFHSPLVSEDWPQFRGPDSDGHARGKPTPLEWSPTRHVKWKTEVPGLGWSSPSVVGDHLFLTTAVELEGKLSLRCLALDVATGRTLWEKEVFTLDQVPRIHKKNSHASPTPLVDQGNVYVHFGTYGMACLSAKDGSIQWKNQELNYPPQHGSGASPVLYDNRLMVTCDGAKRPFVVAIDALTGKIAWKTLRSADAKIKFSFATPIVAKVGGQPQLMAPGSDQFAAYDVTTGKEIWQVRAPGWSVVPQPVIGHGMIFYNHDYDHPELMGVRLGGRGDVTQSHVAWKIKKGAPSTPSPLLVGDELYFVSDRGIASCVDAKTGKRHWMERLRGNYSASPLFANGRILFLNETGLASWVKTGTKFEVLGTNQLPGRTLATPAISNGAMYIRTDSSLYRISND
ncbi:MAG: PQQ-binding-like beta-propeller repeat protein [Planctomycetota bacterium]|nr:PQQ-binding-like beta-propeller repeat protein [Planctomycetota bacterium]